MQNLLPTLLDHDIGMLEIIARRWDVDLASLDKREAAEMLASAMLDPERARIEWGRLNDTERGALQMLLSAPDHKMTEAQFSRLFGEIRRMGPGRRDREKPHLSPASVAETLYFRGLASLAYDQGKKDMQSFVYMPPDLASVLPAHETGFDLSAEPAAAPEWSDERDEPETVQHATTALVDDLTTLLAYLQIEPVPTEKDALHAEIGAALEPYWLGDHDPARVALMIALAGTLGLAAAEEGIFKPVPAHLRPWLEQSRPRQVRALAETWRDTMLFNELWYTPGLAPEPTGWRNDPLLPRQTLLAFMEMVPPNSWWLVDDLIEVIKAEEPDFQRPAGDYASWYIRDVETGDYLDGFENWDRVDAAVLRFILTGPMHWLGLIDVGDRGLFCRLTAYGRALCGEIEWPDPPDERSPLIVESDGTLRAPRTLSRYERFQVARITDWHAVGDPYVYGLTVGGLRRAAQQGLQVEAIHAFLRRASGEALPEPVVQMLAQWGKVGQADVWLTSAVILRTTTPEALQTMLETPEIRRYLGATLGPMAVIVREGQEHALAAALQEHGILVELA
ncbi:MAG: hypothetical protein GXY36_12525 [Chloroflexi bacterium]|nr:hypothetical protein [Chloroflexota bacterium]